MSQHSALSTAPPFWLAEFIGVPWKEGGYQRDGWACWGPVYEAYRRRGIALPTYSEQGVRTEADQAEIRAIMARDRAAWQEIPLAEARLWDVLVFKLAGRWHCGLVLAPPVFLHCLAKCGTVRERWDTGDWRTIMTGAFRWGGAAPHNAG